MFMKGSNRLPQIWQKTPIAVFCILLVLVSMLLLLWNNTRKSWQANPAIFPSVTFQGQYRIGDGQWQDVRAGQHIPATRGDVTLKGQFHLAIHEEGEDIYLGTAGAETLLSFYLNHVYLTIAEEGFPPENMDVESPTVGIGMCGELSAGYELKTDQPITLTFHNPHTFGNERAIDQFLEELAIYSGLTYENEFMDQGNLERNAGFAFAVAAFALLGTALFSALLRTEGSGRLWLVGLGIFFAGVYYVFSAKGVFYWNDSVIGNTTVLGMCMMLYMLCVSALIVSLLAPKQQKLGNVAVALTGAASMTCAVVSVVTDIRFYDTWFWWAVAQTLANGILILCLVKDSLGANLQIKIRNMGATVLLLGVEADFLGIALGWWQGCLISQYIFLALFVVALVLAWQIIPRNIKAAQKAEKMEAEQKRIRAQLQENRIAIMISQIQPHFIYNTLGTIQYLCKENPDQAAKLVQNFSVYLRGNFSELDNTAPIRFSQELEHVRCYTDIELVRFPDMTVKYDIQAGGFLLPALTVQPMVENAIKHGLMGLEEGGTVTIAAYETDTHYCVKVTDDGVGFDTTLPQDGKKHIGIRNVRERLQMMCGGTLTVESEVGRGTVALIRIPKEGNEE